MDANVIVLISIAILIVLLIFRVPMAFALGIAGMFGLVSYYGLQNAFYTVPLRLHAYLGNFTFTAVPVFIVMSLFAMHAGFATDAFEVARLWLGRFPGGLASATVLACAIFSAASGSGVAAAAALSRAAIPEMIRNKYDPRLATGVVAAIAPLDAMIPPSVTMVIYGGLADTSVARLLLAGIFPGILAATVFIIGISVWTWRNPRIAPPALTEKVAWRTRIVSIRRVWGVVALFAIVMGSIYLGWATSTEAAAFGASGALLLALAMRRLTWRVLSQSLLDTVNTCSMIFLVIAMAFAYSLFITRSGVLPRLVDWVIGLNLARWEFFIAISILYIILGMALDGVSMMVLTLPAMIPILTAMDIDRVWFGILMVLFLEISEVTPPLGLTVYVVKGTVGDLVELADIFKGCFVFFWMWIVVLLLIILFPQIALWLPSTMRGPGG